MQLGTRRANLTEQVCAVVGNDCSSYVCATISSSSVDSRPNISDCFDGNTAWINSSALLLGDSSATPVSDGSWCSLSARDTFDSADLSPTYFDSRSLAKLEQLIINGELGYMKPMLDSLPDDLTKRERHLSWQ